MSKEIRSQKLDSVARCFDRIRKNHPTSAEALKGNVDQQDILSINLERLIQSSVDVGSMLIADRGWLPLPDSMAEVFRVLLQRGIIDKALSERLVKSVGFRNLCVHEYDKVNWDIVYSIVTKHLEDFKKYASAIDAQE